MLVELAEDDGDGELSTSGETIMANDGDSVWTGRFAGGDGCKTGECEDDGCEEAGGVCGTTARRLLEEVAAAVSSDIRISSTCFRFFDGCGVPRGVSPVAWRRCVEGGLDGVDIVPHRDQGGGGTG